ncbi:MAG: DUF1232 domain-containing protein [Anaerolineae bacterium]|nr:DUF1232 domain-containing protein [Anaerolineae bacterium]
MTTTTSSSAGASAFGMFIQLIKEWLKDLGVNSQLFNEIIADGSLPMSARTLATGVLMYLDLPEDIIPEKIRFIGLIDDVLVMVIGLVIIVPLIPAERMAYYHQNYKAVTKIDEYEQILKSVLGILWDRLVQFVETLRKRTFKKKTTEEVAQSAELREQLFDQTMEYVANLNLDPSTIDEDLKVLPAPEKIIGTLASGLEAAQKQQEKGETPSTSVQSVFKRFLLSGSDKPEQIPNA